MAMGDTRFMAASTWPKTLPEAIVYFADPDVAFAEMVKFRWPDGVVTCPTCGSDSVYFTKSRRIWQCRENHTKRQFSVKIGSIMEDSPLGIDKWLVALWLICNAKNGISSYELSRAIGITQNSALFMLHRIRLAMQNKQSGGKLSGEGEVDKNLYTFILDYAGGTYVSQYAGNSHIKAFERWMVTEPANLEKRHGVRVAKQLARTHAAVGDNPTSLSGVQNVWCWAASLPKGLALVNVVMTRRNDARVRHG